MSGEGPRLAELVAGGLLAVSAIAGAAAFVVALQRALATRAEAVPVLEVAPIEPPVAPIGAEAGVFHTVAARLALAPAAPRERSAHPRTRTTFRFLRAYPGAPPRIPHPLAAEEFRSGSCRTCHERGGYSPRFAAYVPLTPHAERGVCLACHVGVDSLAGFATLGADPSTRCALCHGGGGRPRAGISTSWSWVRWPAPGRPMRGIRPPPIRHDLETRQNCLACHGGPAAVAELRTSHPERSDCRSCHLDPGDGVAAFARLPLPAARRGKAAQ